MERITNPLKELAHFNHCVFELGMFALKELIMFGDDAIDCFGPDSPEDAAIPSTLLTDVGQYRGAA